jgi:hypothetical protein
MKDVLGNELNIGDYVCFGKIYGYGLKYGNVRKLNTHFASIFSEEGEICNRKSNRICKLKSKEVNWFILNNSFKNISFLNRTGRDYFYKIVDIGSVVAFSHNRKINLGVVLQRLTNNYYIIQDLLTKKHSTIFSGHISTIIESGLTLYEHELQTNHELDHIPN